MRGRSRRILKVPRLYQRADCRGFYIRLTLTDGKRKEISLGTSDKKEARLRAKREVELLNNQLDGTLTRILTIDEMIEQYFNHKINLAPSTLKRNRQHMSFFRSFMQEFYPAANRFCQINQIHISEFQNFRLKAEVRGKKIAPKTAKESIFVLNNMFEWAYRQGYVHANPVRKIEKVKVTYKPQHVFDEKDVLTILSYCKGAEKHRYLYGPYLTFATTGLRSGELSNLTWDDLDFERKVIKIQTKTLPDGREWSSKTNKNREVKMDDEVFRELKELKAKSVSPWVFVNTKGNRQTEYMLWENLRALCRRLGIQRGQVHSFRRTFACLMDKTVQDRVAIKETLGHSTLTMTDRYCGYRPKEYIDKAHLKTTRALISKLHNKSIG